MTVIVCVDDRMGMAFGGRRLSSDGAVCADMLSLASGARLRCGEKSAKLFDGLGGNIAAGADFAERAGAGEFCFVELQPVGALPERARRLVIYRWNRRYPADLYFDASLDGWRLAETAEFPGTSHEKITREVYVRE